MITFQDVTIELNGVRALEEVSLCVEPGELMGLVGPSGAGKSVLLKAACGLIPVTSGRIEIAETPLNELSEDEILDLRRRIGMLFQQGALFDALSVFENVAFPLRRRDWPEQEITDRVLIELERVGLSHAAHLLPEELSGGMRKRTGIARALVTDPPVGLFDEPIAGLDPVTGSRILNLLRTASTERKVTSIAVGHELDTLLPVCDRVAMLLDGRLVYLGSASEMPEAEHLAVRQFFMGSEEGPL